MAVPSFSLHFSLRELETNVPVTESWMITAEDAPGSLHFVLLEKLVLKQSERILVLNYSGHQVAR